MQWISARTKVARPVVWTTLLASLLCLGFAGAAWGHAALRESNPAKGAVVASVLSEIVLTYSESVETAFSTFKVYPLKVVDSDDAAQIQAAADALVKEVLALRGDEAARADAGLVDGTSGASPTVRIKLKEGLAPGRYVVMWRALSVDTHVIQDYFVFTYAPQAASPAK